MNLITPAGLYVNAVYIGIRVFAGQPRGVPGFDMFIAFWVRLQMVPGDTFVRLKVVLADVVSVSGNLVLIKTQHGKTLRLPKHRLYDAEKKR